MQWKGTSCCEVLLGKLDGAAGPASQSQGTHVGYDILQSTCVTFYKMETPQRQKEVGEKKPHDWKRGGTSGARRSCDGQQGRGFQETLGGHLSMFSQIKTVHMLLIDHTGQLIPVSQFLDQKEGRAGCDTLGIGEGQSLGRRAPSITEVKMQESRKHKHFVLLC